MEDTQDSSADPEQVVRIQHCETPSEFIAALSPRGDAYRSMLPRAWVFRGHANDTYSLTPAALRHESKALAEFAFHPLRNNREQAEAEREVLTDFLKISDSIGLHLPEDTQTLRRWLENRPKMKVWPPNELLSLMALAQHHGIPTRLLDWSRHPLKAAWFAANEAAQSTDKTARLSVWALSVEMLDMIGDEPKPFTVITAPSATNSNLRAQEGLFTLTKHIAVDESPVDRTPFDELLRTAFQKYRVTGPSPWFHRITLPRAIAEDLEFDLALEGVTRATLFPDFYGVVQSMRDFIRWGENNGPRTRRIEKHIDTFFFSHRSTVRFPLNPED